MLSIEVKSGTAAKTAVNKETQRLSITRIEHATKTDSYSKGRNKKNAYRFD
jgi:hypothetical protein